MTLLQLTTAIYNKLRTEKNPPMGKYSILLALAHYNRPASVADIDHILGTDSFGKGTIDNCLHHQLIELAPSTTRARHYALTDKGKEEVKTLLTPPPPLPPRKPKKQ